MKYVLGLDIGITSVGWAVLNLDEEHVEDLGVRAFNKAENPKTGASLALPRREARCARRRLRRRAGRLRRAKELFVDYNLIDPNRRETAFEVIANQMSPWQLRAEGLDRLLSGEELARALFHIIKRRGFKSNRKKVKKTDDGKMLEGIAANRSMMIEKGYRTAGEMYWCDEKFSNRKRNTTDSYLNTVGRELLEEEIKIIFKRQREMGSPYTDKDFENAVLDVFAWQKPYASGDDIIKLVGKCVIKKDEMRAPRHSYHAERFTLLQKINNLTYITNGNRLRLDDNQRAAIQKLAYKNSKVTYSQVRKAADLSADARFTGLTYLRRPAKGAELEESLSCETATFIEMKGYHTLAKALSGNGMWETVSKNPDLMDTLAYALTFYKTDEDIQEYLSERDVDQAIIDAVSECAFSQTSNLSILAIKKILPYLEDGLHYSEACAKAGYNHLGSNSGTKLKKLPNIPVDMIRNPVVLRALTQARKVVNGVINRYGSPYRIHIEFARDMGKSAEDRKKIERRQKENLKEREELEEQFCENFNRMPNGTDMLKWRLYGEQKGKCAYSMKDIDLSRLYEPGYAEIDHILPYSRSFDDSRANKVLVLAYENQNKRNRTPHECFGHNQERWELYEAWVKSTITDPKKRANLLKESLDAHQEEWKERNLNDTRYIVREFAAFLRNNLLFANDEHNDPLVCVNGQIVARARWLWGFNKERDQDDLHHAIDASVIAALLPYQVRLITEHAKVAETREQYVDKDTGEIIEYVKTKHPRLPMPWKNFRAEVLEKLSKIIVSRMPQRKVSGAIHEETIRSVKSLAGERISCVKKPLTSLTEKDLDNLFDPEHNERLYSAIRQRMAEYDNVAQKAFAAPLYKELRDGSPGPIVKSVKVCQAQYTGVKVRNGIADNGDMIRTDVFRKQNNKGKWEYFIVPVYVSDMISGKLPNKAIAAGKVEEDWPVMDASYEFLFSLYPYDLVRMKTSNVDDLFYYRGTHRSNGALKVSEVNVNSGEPKNVGARNAEIIEKYVIGVLGDYYPVRKEARRGLANGSDLESCEVES